MECQARLRRLAGIARSSKLYVLCCRKRLRKRGRAEVDGSGAGPHEDGENADPNASRQRRQTGPLADASAAGPSSSGQRGCFKDPGMHASLAMCTMRFWDTSEHALPVPW